MPHTLPHHGRLHHGICHWSELGLLFIVRKFLVPIDQPPHTREGGCNGFVEIEVLNNEGYTMNKDPSTFFFYNCGL